MSRKRLGEILVEAGAITEQELTVALSLQVKNGRIGETLLTMGAIDADRLAWALAEQIGVPLLNLSSIFIDPKILQRFNKARCRVLNVLPIGIMEDALTVAAADPFDVVAHDEVRQLAAMPVRIAVATPDSISKAIDKYFTDEVALDEMVSRILPDLASDEDIENEAEALLKQTPIEEYRRDADSRPVLRLVNSIIRDAIKIRASDIHVEPMETSCLVRYRIDGLMRHMVSLPMFLHPRTLCRIKIMASMDIAEHRLPLDGRCRIRFQRNEIDLRISTLPTQHGEKVVIRLLNPRDMQIRLDNIGLQHDSLRQVQQMLRFRQGIILLTGPTGSGKTSTLYSMLHLLKGESCNIVTLENPIEYAIPGINQTQTNEKATMTFAKGFRSILRQDPDVIMIGEIRDAETADIAFNAAMTGHLVLSTLHTNDSFSVPTRLAELGVSRYLIGAALKGAISQRLVRQLCPHCKAQYLPDAEVCRLLGLNPREPVMLWESVGCKLCGGRGYSGRTGVFEVLMLSEKMKEMAGQEHLTAGMIADQAAREGMRDLMEDAILKVIQGVTGLDEVKRIVELEERRRVCPRCQHRAERHLETCPLCGLQLSKSFCRACGRDLEHTWSFCPYCAREAHAAGPDEAAPATPVHDADVEVPTYPEGAHCKNCGMMLKFNWEECPLCLKPCDASATASRNGAATPPVSLNGNAKPQPDAAVSDLPRRVLLVVTDDPRTVVELRKVAIELGAAVVHASTGPDTMRNLEVNEPTGVLIDAAMPTLDGSVLYRKIRSARPDVRVALLMPTDHCDLGAPADEAGVDVMLHAPVLATDLAVFLEPCAKALIAPAPPLDTCKG